MSKSDNEMPRMQEPRNVPLTLISPMFILTVPYGCLVPHDGTDDDDKTLEPF